MRPITKFPASFKKVKGTASFIEDNMPGAFPGYQQFLSGYAAAETKGYQAGFQRVEGALAQKEGVTSFKAVLASESVLIKFIGNLHEDFVGPVRSWGAKNLRSLDPAFMAYAKKTSASSYRQANIYLARNVPPEAGGSANFDLMEPVISAFNFLFIKDGGDVRAGANAIRWTLKKFHTPRDIIEGFDGQLERQLMLYGGALRLMREGVDEPDREAFYQKAGASLAQNFPGLGQSESIRFCRTLDHNMGQRFPTKKQKREFLSSAIPLCSLSRFRQEFFENLSLTDWYFKQLDKIELSHEYKSKRCDKNGIFDQDSWQALCRGKLTFTSAEHKTSERIHHSFPEWHDVPEGMQQLAQQVVELAKTQPDPIHLACKLHNEIVKLHPYADANGRLARTMLNAVLMFHGLPPLLFQGKGKKMYHRACELMDSDEASFVTFISGQLQHSLSDKMVLATRKMKDNETKALGKAIRTYQLHYPKDDVAMTSKGYTPLHYACSVQKESAVRLLLAAGFDPDIIWHTESSNAKRKPDDLLKGELGNKLAPEFARIRSRKAQSVKEQSQAGLEASPLGEHSVFRPRVQDEVAPQPASSGSSSLGLAAMSGGS